jgi:hypothetical protein
LAQYPGRSLLWRTGQRVSCRWRAR